MQKSSVNKVIIVGRLGQDPDGRFTPQGTAVSTLSIATSESWRGNDGEIQEKTEWHRAVMFGKMAETANEYLTKGQLVYVEGRAYKPDHGRITMALKNTPLKFVLIILPCWAKKESPLEAPHNRQRAIAMRPQMTICPFRLL